MTRKVSETNQKSHRLILYFSEDKPFELPVQDISELTRETSVVMSSSLFSVPCMFPFTVPDTWGFSPLILLHTTYPLIPYVCHLR